MSISVRAEPTWPKTGRPRWRGVLRVGDRKWHLTAAELYRLARECDHAADHIADLEGLTPAARREQDKMIRSIFG